MLPLVQFVDHMLPNIIWVGLHNCLLISFSFLKKIKHLVHLIFIMFLHRGIIFRVFFSIKCMNMQQKKQLIQWINHAIMFRTQTCYISSLMGTTTGSNLSYLSLRQILLKIKSLQPIIKLKIKDMPNNILFTLQLCFGL